MLNELFLQMAIVILTAGLLSLIAYKLRQPLIIAYILTGMVVGPGLLGFVTSEGTFETLSSLGIAFLLFIVGLNLNWKNVRDVGGVALVAGVVQIIVTSGLGFLIALLLNFEPSTALFLGIAFAFSSTIIIVKLLADKEDIERMYGRIAVGILLVQDLVAMMLLLFLSAYGQGEHLSVVLGYSLLKGIGAVAVLWLLSKFIVPHLFRYAARSQELLFLMAIAWCFAVASALQLLGFGIEIGALMAGVALAGSGFQHEIEAKIRALRDFFLVIFFIVLGTQLTPDVGALLVPGLVFSAFVLIGNPLIVMCIMRVMGHHPRSGFLAGTTLAQISEFSFILITGGIAVGLVDASALPLATVVGLVTIAGSSYMIAYNEHVYEFLAKHLPFMRAEVDERDADIQAAPQVVLLGYDRMGQQILPTIQAKTDKYLIIDFNPSIVELLSHEGKPALYGDVGSEDVLRLAQVHKAKVIISTIPDMAVNADIMDYVRHTHSQAAVILTVKSSGDAVRAYQLGATFVIVPSILGGEHFAQLFKKKGVAKASWKTLGSKEKSVFETSYE